MEGPKYKLQRKERYRVEQMLQMQLIHCSSEGSDNQWRTRRSILSARYSSTSSQAEKSTSHSSSSQAYRCRQIHRKSKERKDVSTLERRQKYLGFKGSIYTWWNGRSEEDCIFKRLDRCLGNMEFQQTFPGLQVTHLSKTGSDHSPMLLKYDIESPPIKKSFRFLNFWTKHHTFKEVVKENWSADFSASPFTLFNFKLKKLKKALSTWSRATYGDIFQKIASLEEVVLVHERQFECNPSQMNRQRLQEVQAEMIRYLALEEEFWRQKAGMMWFKDGDRNTKFFHAQVNGRRKRLRLTRIQNSDGNWIEEEDLIAEEAVKFYQDQFTEDAVPTTFDILNHVPNMVDSEQNEKLMAIPTKEEVKKAVMGLSGDSAGGPDGYTGAFYQSCWDIIEDDL
ncbi:PREDICTED: uncharacterized protein LOC109221967, partial [Nicotiana attenuata]|uniref:uncharacterized protein LOC109221967 n=1 Tax=Nicotiana attenuata TaxID=49451 RepID=UPI0009058E23